MDIEMPPAETKQLKRLMAKATRYLEYGSGGSTAAASRSPNIETIVTVESDAGFLGQLLETLPEGEATIHATHADVGPTKTWGYPARPASNYKKFPNYVSAPWDLCRELSLSPDLILIDGRFRVAAFVYSVVNARPGATLFFDDYANRPHYHGVAELVAPARIVGRSATFRAPRKLDHVLAAKLLLQAAVDFR